MGMDALNRRLISVSITHAESNCYSVQWFLLLIPGERETFNGDALRASELGS